MAQRALIVFIVALCAVCSVASRTGPATSDVPMRKLTATQAGIYWPARSCDFVQDDEVECDGDTPTVACCDTKTCYKDHSSGNYITCDKKPYDDYPTVGCCPKPNSVEETSNKQNSNKKQSTPPPNTKTQSTQYTTTSSTVITRQNIIPNPGVGSILGLGRH